MTVQHRNRLFSVAVLAVAILVATTTVAIVEVNGKGGRIRGKTSGVGIGLYWDNAFTNRTVAVDWGQFSAGAAKSVTLYVRNEGSLAVKLNLTTKNWSPTNASELMTLTWNREGQVLGPQTVAKATLTLSVSANISGITNFGFDTTVRGV